MKLNTQKRTPITFHFYDDGFDPCEGIVVECSGNLSLVRDLDTGEESYRCPHEINEQVS